MGALALSVLSPWALLAHGGTGTGWPNAKPIPCGDLSII